MERGLALLCTVLILGCQVSSSSKTPAIPYVKLYESALPTPARNTPRTFGRKFTWTFEGREYTLLIDIDIEEYNACQGHEHSRDRYIEMVERGRRQLQPLTEEFFKYTKAKGWGRRKTIDFVLSFVQALPYRSDAQTLMKEDYPRDAIQTLVDIGNDCEDSSILLASILSGMGFEVALLNPERHIALGVAGNFSGFYIIFRGKKFFYCETTGTGWSLGEVPNEYRSGKIKLYPIKAGRSPVILTPVLRKEKVSLPRWTSGLKEIYLVIDKARHKLYVFNGDTPIRVFTVDTGREPGPKTKEGDERTPEGRYRIVDIRKPWDEYKYGSYFLELNYPNYMDWKRGRTGSGIGIHGTVRRRVLGRNITDGCIVMNDDDLKDLVRLVGEGTPVFIYSSLPGRVSLRKAPAVARRFGNFVHGPSEVGELFSITVMFPKTEAYDAEWARVVFSFREDSFEVPERINEGKIYRVKGFTVVEVTDRDWRRNRSFTVKVVPKRVGKLDYFVRLVLRKAWGYITYPQYGLLDPTGSPAILREVKVR